MDLTSTNLLSNCPLCQSEGHAFYKDTFYKCVECGGIFRNRADYPSFEEERSRYQEHENDVDDARYQHFVSPITDVVQEEQSLGSIGLDFGSGTAPVISKILTDAGYAIRQYDPIFQNEPEVLESRYDYIVCCEVIEHFHDPLPEFHRLKKLLKPNGRLYCMTLLYHAGIDFSNWHYQRDETHVFIYQEKTLEWIQQAVPFTSIVISGRLITFSE